jgi:DNA-binding beta-propeller fold protein YncE
VRRIATDSRDRVYVCHRDLFKQDLPPVTILDSDGNFVGGWGQGFFQGLHGIFITPDDHVFVVDTDRHQVFKFTTEGELLMTLGTRQPAFDAPFNHPSDVTVSKTGEIYVADGDANTCIHKFSKDGKHLLSWGTAGKGRGQFTTPHSVCVDSQNRVIVGDRDTGRIILFSSEGKYLSEWADILWRPASLYIDSDEVFYVADMDCHVNMYDSEGTVVARAHAAAPPHSVWGDTKGNLYFAFPDGFPYIEKWERISKEEAAQLWDSA